jgi:signal transduction histidine kinase
MQAQDEQEGEQEDSSLPVRTQALVAELLATMSHELRTPLATIKAYTATLLGPRKISPAERRAFLLAIERASDHLEVVIEHLLELAALETGTQVLEPSTVNLAQLIREAISAREHRADAERAVAAGRLHFHLENRGSTPGDEVFLIEADRYRLRKVLDQLLENAITYSPEGGTIEVSLRMVSPPNRAERSGLPPHGGLTSQMASSHQPELPGEQEWVEISVRDEGQGIAAEHLERVFDPFYRVDMRLAREVNGLGIGLAICKRIVELHGGVIWAESTVGAGSTFHVWLPRVGPLATST